MFHCIGCGAKINWDGKELFSYTCPCGATIFVNDETGNVAFPASFIRNLHRGISLPHLDDLVGLSEYTSLEKEVMITELKKKGFIWMEECEECQKNGTLQRYRDRQSYFHGRFKFTYH